MPERPRGSPRGHRHQPADLSDATDSSPPHARVAGSLYRLLLCAAVAGSLAGCGALRGYRAEMDETLRLAASADVPGAIRILDRNNGGSKKDLLYYMEVGELKRLQNDFPGSFEALRLADAEVLAWEAAARLDPTRSVGQAASFLVNDKVRTYEGQDYEKVMVTTRMAMDHLAMGDWDKARVEIKRTHEREALIAEVRAKEYRKVEDEARAKGAKVSFKEISGYPVQGLETPESLALRNGYQNALSHYLAGFVYESLGEASLSAPGYRTAIELRPGQPVLEAALGGLDARLGAPDDGQCDVLFVVETGSVPGRVSQSFNIPIPVFAYGTVTYVQISFPILPPRAMGYQAPDVQVDGNASLPTAHILDLDAMARRALADEMPGIMLRAFTRSATKAVAQFEMQRRMAEQRRHRDDGANLGAALALLAFQVGGAIVEQADERGWRSLPAQVSLARVRLPAGQHNVSVRSDNGSTQFPVNLSGKHALVSVRLFRGAAYVAPPAGSVPGTAPAQSTDGGPGGPMYAEVRVIALPSPSSPSWRTLQ